MAKTQLVTNSLPFGIAAAHWNAILDFASSRAYVICLRGGKTASIRYIERGYPAKPLEVKCKVDPVLGLLLARDAAAQDSVWRAGLAVLRAAGAGSFTAQGRGGTDACAGFRFSRPRQDWAQEFVVVDAGARLPITSDYDLAAVVDTKHFDYNTTYALMAGQANRTNPLVMAVAGELNGRFGSRRIMHGTEAQYFGSMAHDDTDAILIFHPDRTVEQFGPAPVLETDVMLHDIFRRYFPGRDQVFNQ